GTAPGPHERALPEPLHHAHRAAGLDQQVRPLAGMRSVIDLLAPVDGIDDRFAGARIAVREQALAQLGDDTLVLRARLDDALRLATSQVHPQSTAGRRGTVCAGPAPVDPSRHLAERGQRLRDRALEPPRYHPGHPAEPRSTQTSHDGARIDPDRAEAAVRDAVTAQGEKAVVGEPV